MREIDATGPLRHRLSEPPETPTEAPTERQPGQPPSPPANALGLRAAALLNSLPRPAELSPAALVRIRERIETVVAPALPRPWWQWAASLPRW